MHSKYQDKRPLIVFVVYPNIKLLDLAGPLQCFTDAVDAHANTAYQTAIVSTNGASVVSDTLVSIETEPMHDYMAVSIDTLIIVGGDGAKIASQDLALLNGIRKLGCRSNRIGSVCSGAFILAACGLLKDRRAVTHWESCQELASLYPDIKVEHDPIFIRDNNIWTSAGVTAGLDMALAMISEDLGRLAALTLARSLVAYIVRPGGQSQFSEALHLETKDSKGRFDKLHHWIRSNLDKDLRVTILADQTFMSARNFARVYTAETKQTPAKAVEALRVEAARNMLEASSLSIKVIAKRCGFNDEESMRRSFARLLKITPGDYSKRFKKVSNDIRDALE